MSALLADPKLLWYLARSTGVVCLVLLTVSTALGLVAAGRLRSSRWPRFVTQSLHRTVALLAVLLLAGHVVAVVADDYVEIGVVEAFVPFVGTYRPLWLGLGAIATDLLVLLIVTSLLRTRLPHAVWRGVHLTAYACWPVSVLHGLGTGSDPRQAWFAGVAVACAVVVGAALLRRLWTATARPASLRIAGGVLTLATLAGIAGWAGDGPMRPGWAARADTPVVGEGGG